MSLRTTLLGVSLLFISTAMAMVPQQSVPAEAPVQHTQAEQDQVDKYFGQIKNNAETVIELQSEHLACLAQEKTEQAESLKQRISALEEENRQILAKIEPLIYNEPLMGIGVNFLKALYK